MHEPSGLSEGPLHIARFWQDQVDEMILRGFSLMVFVLLVLTYVRR